VLAVVQKWGNSQGLSFSKDILNKAQLSIGDEVFVSVQDRQIIVKAAAQVVRGKYSLQELLAKMPHDYKPYEENWGSPVGKEIW